MGKYMNIDIKNFTDTEPVDWVSKFDNNDGYIFGIHYLDEYGNIIAIQWFKTESERDQQL